MTLAELVDEYLKVHQAARATIEKLRWLLSKATAAFGDRPIGSLRSEEICAWRGTLPEGHRFEATQALRQVLNAAVAWELIDVNPARRGVPNPLRRFPEKRPFESWKQINALAAELDAVTGPMVVFGAATGLRPAELVAIEQRDVDRTGGVVYVRRQYAGGQVKHTKTRRSVRAVPLQAAALEALDQLPTSDSRLLFAAPHGGYIDLHNFRPRHWRRAQIAAGIEPVRRPYDLRHTYATFALRAGISIFDLSRFMGASLAMIDSTTAISPATAAIMPSRFSTRTRAIPPHGRQVDVAAAHENPRDETARAVIDASTFGAVDVSWTPPLRNVFPGDNESRC